jgi:hypothetical protein
MQEQSEPAIKRAEGIIKAATTKLADGAVLRLIAAIYHQRWEGRRREEPECAVRRRKTKESDQYWQYTVNKANTEAPSFCAASLRRR